MEPLKPLSLPSRYYTRVGFTLVELLVVIAIIAVLASILTVVISKATASSRSVGNMSNLRNLGMELTVYAQDVGHYPPAWDDQYDTKYPSSGGNEWPRILTQQQGNGSVRDLFLSPNLGSSLSENHFQGKWQPTNYSGNNTIFYHSNENADSASFIVRPVQILRPSEVILLADGKPTDPEGEDSTMSCHPAMAAKNAGQWQSPGYGQRNTKVTEFWWAQPDFGRHSGGKAQFLFVDGHVEALTEDDLEVRHFAISF